MALVLLLVLGYYLFKKPKVEPGTAAAAVSPTTNTPKTASANTPKPVISDDFPFDVGSQGPNVKRLQNALNLIKPQNKIVESGVFDSATRVKLLLTLPATLSQLPMTKAAFNQIIHIAVT